MKKKILFLLTFLMVGCGNSTSEIVDNKNKFYDVEITKKEISKDEYIDRDLLKNWQYPSTEDNTLFYEFENVSKILLPQDIESSVLEGGIVTYSEIVLTGNVHPIGVFYTDKCKDIEKAKQYAEKYNLELIHITPNLDKVYIK